MKNSKCYYYFCLLLFLNNTFYCQTNKVTNNCIIDTVDMSKLDTNLQKNVKKELVKIAKEYDANNLFCIIINAESNKIISKYAYKPSENKNNLYRKVLSAKLLTPIITNLLIHEYNFDDSFKLKSNGMCQISKSTQDSIIAWSKMMFNDSINKTDQMDSLFNDQHLYEDELYDFNISINQYKFSIVYKALDSLINKSLFVKFNNLGIKNPLSKYQSIFDVLCGYKNIFDIQNKNYMNKMLKLKKYKNLYGVFSSMHKSDNKFQPSFIGHINNSNNNYIIFVVADVSVGRNNKFYSSEVYDGFLRKLENYSLFNKEK